MVRGGPLLDEDLNIYISAEDGFRKFTKSGQMVWHYQPLSPVPHVISIMDGSVFGVTSDGTAHAVSMSSGRLLWSKKVSASAPGDTCYSESYAGMVFVGVDPGPVVNGGAGRIVALNATDGEQLWDFKPDVSAWNFMPMFPDDGTLLFQDYDSGVYRLNMTTGELVYRVGRTGGRTWTDGNMILGPGGSVVYAVSYSRPQHENAPDQPGAIHAYRVSDGKLLWESSVPRPPHSWPVVGRLSKGAPLQVIIPIGAQAFAPRLFDAPGFLPDFLKLLYHKVSVLLGDYGRFIWTTRVLPTEVHAFDAETGARAWTWQGPTWYRPACAGDEEGLVERYQLGHQMICGPGPWTAPTMDAAGTIYVGNQDGYMYALRDDNADGQISDSEVSSYDLQASQLHAGPSVAPGMMAIGSCDGLFVFRTDVAAQSQEL